MDAPTSAVTQSPLELFGLSVVITAEYYNPALFDPNLLASEGIVPFHWSVKKAAVSSSQSVIQYDDVQLSCFPAKLELGEKFQPPGRQAEEPVTSAIFDIAKAYVSKYPWIPYRDLGLNCDLLIRRESGIHASKWLSEIFIPWMSDYHTIVSPAISVFLSQNVIAKFTLQPVVVDQEKELFGVHIDANINHDGPLSPHELSELIDQWPEKQKLIVEAVREILGGNPQ